MLTKKKNDEIFMLSCSTKRPHSANKLIRKSLRKQAEALNTRALRLKTYDKTKAIRPSGRAISHFVHKNVDPV